MSDASADPMRVTALTIDYIFRRLLARYGSTFEQKWPEAAIGDAKADWLSVLGPDDKGRGGLTAGQVNHALANLPKDFPPNSAQFRDAALRASDSKPKLAHEVKADPKRLAAILATALPAMRARHPRTWVEELQARKDAGESLTIAQLDALAAGSKAPPPDSAADASLLAKQRVAIQKAADTYEREHAVAEEPSPDGYSRRRNRS